MFKQLLCALLALVLALCLFGCGEAPLEPAALEIGMDVCAESSRYKMAETEQGYYLTVCESRLYYADKSDLSNWVVVCTNPVCNHTATTCSSMIHSFYIDNDRIYSIQIPASLASLLPEDDTVGEFYHAVFSMALDGTDLRQEYKIEGSDLDKGGFSYVTLYGKKAFGAYALMQNDGTFQAQIVAADKNGTTCLYSQDGLETMLPGGDIMFPLNLTKEIRGDICVRSCLLDGTDDYANRPYRLTEDGFEAMEGVTADDLMGAYLKGDQVYRFIANDGYYLMDLSTGESKKWMDAQLADSEAYHLTDQFILESTAYGSVEKPELRFYDGAQWHAISLPADTSMFSGEVYYAPLALTTEHLFLHASGIQGDKHGDLLFCVPLSGSYAMEYCGFLSAD